MGVLLPQTFMNESGALGEPGARGRWASTSTAWWWCTTRSTCRSDGSRRAWAGAGRPQRPEVDEGELGSADFQRIRVGVGRPDSTDPEIVSAHVLGRFREPKDEVSALVERAADELERLVLAPA